MPLRSRHGQVRALHKVKHSILRPLHTLSENTCPTGTKWHCLQTLSAPSRHLLQALFWDCMHGF